MNEKEHRYRNKFEARTGQHLDELGVNFDYESERLDYTVTGRYVPDFIIQTRRGKTLYIETKGNGRSFDGPTRRKMVAVKQQHPDKDIRIVFYSDGAIGPKRKDGSRLRQSEWADKNGFKWAIREIPQEWLDE